jgi:hypothetical protein
LKAQVEKRTGWTSEQLEHRVKRYKKLPAAPTKRDLETVAANLLQMRWNGSSQTWDQGGPSPSIDLIDVVVGYGLTCKMRLPAMADTIEEARYQARQDDRSVVTGVDIQKALLQYRIPTDGALHQAFAPWPRREALGVQMSQV